MGKNSYLYININNYVVCCFLLLFCSIRPAKTNDDHLYEPLLYKIENDPRTNANDPSRVHSTSALNSTTRTMDNKKCVNYEAQVTYKKMAKVTAVIIDVKIVLSDVEMEVCKNAERIQHMKYNYH